MALGGRTHAGLAAPLPPITYPLRTPCRYPPGIPLACLHTHLLEIHSAVLLGVLNLQGGGRPPLSYQVVMDWLNSYQYHFDSAKRAAIERDVGSLGNVQNGVGAVLIALVEMIQSSLSTGDFIETLERCVEGTLPEVSCSIEYFEVSRK